jgi:branched-chain amino acid transport system substrate-binding protein
MLEGYIAAAAFTEGVKRSGAQPTRAKLRKALEGMNDLDLGGFRISFEGGRTGSKLVELGLIDFTGKIRE